VILDFQLIKKAYRLFVCLFVCVCVCDSNKQIAHSEWLHFAFKQVARLPILFTSNTQTFVRWCSWFLRLCIRNPPPAWLCKFSWRSTNIVHFTSWCVIGVLTVWKVSWWSCWKNSDNEEDDERSNYRKTTGLRKPMITVHIFHFTVPRTQSYDATDQPQLVTASLKKLQKC
jgi:hypothetical protein